MKKKNTQAIVLRAGLSLSMFFGIAAQTDHVFASETDDDAIQENASAEITPEAAATVDVETFDDVEKEEGTDETELETEEESEDSQALHSNDEPATGEEMEDIQPEEAVLADEVLTEEIVDETIEQEISEEQTGEETIKAEDKHLSEKEASLESDSAPAEMTMSASRKHADETIKVDRIHGQNRFKNAVEISKKGWSSAPKVFLANGHKFTDSLTGSPLAALNNAPLLLTNDNSLPAETLAELKRLNTKEVVILGGELSISQHIVNLLKQNGMHVIRIGGSNRYTQAELVANEIMKAEGKNRDAFLASGEVFSDALSIATVASNKRLPIFLTRGNRLNQSVLNAIPYVNSWTIIGGELTINRSLETEMKKAGAKVKRIEGQNRYEVNRNILNYYGVPKEHLYVTSGEHYSDTLPASILASKEKSGILLLRNNRKKTNDEQQLFAQSKHDIQNFTFVGGPLTLSEETRKAFETPITTVDEDMLEIIKRQYSGYTFSQYNITLQDALDMQMQLRALPQTDKRYTAFVSKDFINGRTHTVTADILNVRSGAGSNHHIIAQLRKNNKVHIINETDNWYQIDLKQAWVNATPDDVDYYLNPNNFILSERQKFQFLDLSKTSNATAAELNKFLKGKGILEGQGQAFIDAGKLHGVNEIYLLSHALHETGNGASALAMGVQINGNKAYNMYGIGAYDSDPLKYGSLRAYEEEWFTPEKAIIGGAAFIGDDYIKVGQNTLYKMRWNPESMATHGYASHQYATDIGWSYKQVNTIYNLYQSIGISVNYVDIPVYLA